MTCRLRWCLEMETRCRIPIWQTFGQIQWHVIPEPHITLQGAPTWWIYCQDFRATCRYPLQLQNMDSAITDTFFNGHMPFTSTNHYGHTRRPLMATMKKLGITFCLIFCLSFYDERWTKLPIHNCCSTVIMLMDSFWSFCLSLFTFHGSLLWAAVWSAHTSDVCTKLHSVSNAVRMNAVVWHRFHNMKQFYTCYPHIHCWWFIFYVV